MNYSCLFFLHLVKFFSILQTRSVWNWVEAPVPWMKSPKPFALSLQRIVFSLFSQHYTGLTVAACLEKSDHPKSWLSMIVFFPFSTDMLWVLVSWMLRVGLCPSPACVNGPGWLMDQVTHSFHSSVTCKLYQLLFLLSVPGWNAILHLTYANLKSINECNFSLASFWDLQAGHFLILLVFDYVQFIFLTYGARSMPYKNLSMLHLCSSLC